MAYNTYPGWYWADPATMRYAVVWKYKPEDKQPGLGVSEYGAGVYQHEEKAKKPTTDGAWHPEEWQRVGDVTKCQKIIKAWHFGTYYADRSGEAWRRSSIRCEAREIDNKKLKNI